MPDTMLGLATRERAGFEMWSHLWWNTVISAPLSCSVHTKWYEGMAKVVKLNAVLDSVVHNPPAAWKVDQVMWVFDEVKLTNQGVRPRKNLWTKYRKHSSLWIGVVLGKSLLLGQALPHIRMSGGSETFWSRFPCGWTWLGTGNPCLVEMV